MNPVDFQLPTRLVAGPGKIGSLGSLAAELGARRALVVSDPGIVAAGHTAAATACLEAAGLEWRLFDQIAENPTTEHVAQGCRVAADYQPDLLIGLGGGSSLDCAKGINFLHTNGGQMQDYWGRGKARLPMLPMIGVPTTAGTGSEMQSFALISDATTHAKMACGDKKAACRIALLDPELTVTQPPRVTALTGIDALAHALETYVTKARNPLSLVFSREAWRLLERNFARVLAEPTDVAARGAMQLGAALAGVAIESSMLGATHALANPLTAEFGIAHGEAIGLMLPHVIRFNGPICGAWYEELLQLSSGAGGGPPPAAGAGGLAEFIANLVAQAGLRGRLEQFGIPRDRLPVLADQAATQWTGGFNPRPVEARDLLALYEAAY